QPARQGHRIHSRFRKGGKGYRTPRQENWRGGLHCLPLRTHKESLGQTQLLIRKAPARARKKEKEGRKSRPQARRQGRRRQRENESSPPALTLAVARGRNAAGDRRNGLSAQFHPAGSARYRRLHCQAMRPGSSTLTWAVIATACAC